MLTATADGSDGPARWSSTRTTRGSSAGTQPSVHRAMYTRVRLLCRHQSRQQQPQLRRQPMHRRQRQRLPQFHASSKTGPTGRTARRSAAKDRLGESALSTAQRMVALVTRTKRFKRFLAKNESAHRTACSTIGRIGPCAPRSVAAARRQGRGASTCTLTTEASRARTRRRRHPATIYRARRPNRPQRRLRRQQLSRRRRPQLRQPRRRPTPPWIASWGSGAIFRIARSNAVEG